MKHVIIGTAGHVDHGKTLLVKALTGIETDRLAEEKKRGITIEPGFAHLEWNGGLQAGIVDVPGHEKFIRNMLSGAGGIDLCMLAVAADEGFMPQTVEHLDIMELLGIRNGITVITKKDAVDPDWLEMMFQEIRQRVKGTFLEEKPVLAVSAYTGEGIGELKERLYEQVFAVQERNARIPFRLPVDRVFSVDGFGTVVTGTLIAGSMKEGEDAVLMPSGTKTRVRSLQVYGKKVAAAYAGQRVAVNLAGLHRNDIKRGDAVVKPGSLCASRMLDVKLSCLKNSRRVIASDSRVHFYHGTEEQVAKVVLLGRERLLPGENCYAQLRMAEPVAAKKGDGFVIRFFSPLETVGGGVILDSTPDKHKRNDAAALAALRIKESGSENDKVLQVMAEFGTAIPDLDKLAEKLGKEKEALQSALQELILQGHAVEILEGRYAAACVVGKIRNRCEKVLADYHEQNPLQAGMKAAQLRQKLFKGIDQSVAEAFLRELCREDCIRRVGEEYALSGFSIRFTKRQNAVRARLRDIYKKADIEPASLEDIIAIFPPNEKADCRQVLDRMLSDGELMMLAPQICYHKNAYEKVRRVMREHFAANKTLSLAQMRDALGTSRKYALVILEHFDRLQITRKDGDFRSPGKNFEKMYE